MRNKPLVISNQRRARTVWSAALSCLLLLSLRAQSGNEGVLYGSVLKPPANTSVPGVTVTLRWEENGKPVERRVVTDAEGGYEFAGLPVDDATSFSLSATVDGKPIKREGIALSTWTPRTAADLMVTEVVSDPSKVHIGRLTTILPPSESLDMPRVIEFLEIHNKGETNFAQTDAQGRTIGFRLSLPSTAHGVEVEGKELATSVEGTEVLLTQPLQPGSTTLSVSYMVRAGKDLELSRVLHFPVTEFLVLVGNPAWELKTREYQRGESANIHGTEYATFTRRNLAAGESLEVVFKKGRGSAGGARGGQEGVPTFLVVLIGIVALAAGGAIGGWAIQTRRVSASRTRAASSARETDMEVSAVASRESSARGLKPTYTNTTVPPDKNLLQGLNREQLEAIKRVHLDLIARLDDYLAAGDLPDALHQRLRGEQKASLGQVIAQLEIVSR